MKKILKISLPILVLVASFFAVSTLIAAKPAPEKSEPKARLISLFVDKVESEVVTLSVNTQGEVKPKTEIDLIPICLAVCKEIIKDLYSSTLFVASNSNLKEKGNILPPGAIRRKPAHVPSLE